MERKNQVAIRHDKSRSNDHRPLTQKNFAQALPTMNVEVPIEQAVKYRAKSLISAIFVAAALSTIQVIKPA